MKKIIIIVITVLVSLGACTALYKITRPYLLFSEAQSSIARNDFKDALKRLQILKEQYPEFVQKKNEVNFFMGLAHTAENNYYRASNAFYEVAKDEKLLQSLSEKDRLLVGSVFVETDNGFQAIKVLNSINKDELGTDQLSTYYINLAEAYLEKDKNDKASEYAEKALNSPNELSQMEKAKINLIRFVLYLQDKKYYNPSEEEVQEAFGTNQYDLFYLNYSVPIASMMLPDFEKTVIENFNPENNNPQLNTIFYTIFSDFYREKGDYESAKNYLEKALAIYQDYVPSYLSYAKIYTEQKDFEQAIEYYKKAAEIDDKYFRTQNGLGWAYYELGEPYFDDARNHLNKTIEMDPEYSRPYNTLGTICSALNESEKAIEYYKKALQFEEYAKPYKNLMLEYDKLGNTKLAQENYEKFVKLGGDE